MHYNDKTDNSFRTIGDDVHQLPPIDSLKDSTPLRAKYVAVYLDVSVNTLAHWRHTGRYAIPFVKVGSSIRYLAGDIKAFIASRTVGVTA